MKKLLALLGLCIASTSMNSQTYGVKVYPRNTSQLSSGILTSLNGDGFLMAGFRATSTATDANFYVDKTDTSGFFSGTSQFSRRYALHQPSGSGQGCSSIGRSPDCWGVTAVETSLANGSTYLPAYAVAATTSRGIFFSCLNVGGNPISPVFYEFPTGVATAGITKPLLAEATYWPGLPPGVMYYYICGNYNIGTTQYMYILVVRQDGSLIMQDVWDIGASDRLEPKAILPSQVNPGDLVIVGLLDQGGFTGIKGFFMEMTPGSGAPPTIFNYYGQTGFFTTDYFTSITQVNTNEYLIGGFTDSTGTGATDWFVSLDIAGSFNWSSIFTPNGTLDNINGVVGVTSCLNTTGNRVDYGVSYSPSKGMVVMKLDGLGNAYTGIPPLDDNTFEYTDANWISGPTSISSKRITGPADQGIQVYGTVAAGVGSAHYFVEAYLNGEQACLPPRSPLGSTSAGPTSSTLGPALTISSPFSQPCLNAMMIDSDMSPRVLNIICAAGSMSSGSNAKPAQVTGLSEKPINSDFGIWPNPTDGKVTISYRSQNSEKTHFVVYNSLGQVVKTIDTSENTSGENTYILDLKDQDAGIYFLSTKIKGVYHSQKLIYTKN